VLGGENQSVTPTARDDARRVSLGEVLAVAVVAVALSIAMHWPLVLHLGTDFPKDLGDPLPQAWQVAWGGHSLGSGVADYFQSNQFWPLRDTLAFSDALIGYAPAGLIGDGPTAAIVRYNVLFFFAYALSFVGAYLLCRELGISRTAALVGAAAFAYAPWRLAQDAHLHVLSSGPIPLALYFLLRGWRLCRPWMTLSAFAIVAWALAIGFSIGLLLAYAIGVVGIVALVAWNRLDRPSLDRRMVVATGIGLAMLAGTAFLLTRPYLRVVSALPEAKRDAAAVNKYGEGPWIFLAGPAEGTVWGPLTSPVRDHLGFVPEQTLFPGLAIAALAFLGARARSPFSRPLRRGLVATIAILMVLSLGFRPGPILQWLPYRFVYEFAPGFSAIRVPERLMVLTTLLLAVLAGAGAHGLLAAARSRRGWSLRAPRLAAILPAVLLGAVLLDGAGFGIAEKGQVLAGYAHPTAPVRPKALDGIPGPQLHLPASDQDNRVYLLWSTAGFPKMMNGKSSVTPRLFLMTVASATSPPDRDFVAELRRLGVRSVVVHLRRVKGTAWEDWATGPADNLGMTREVRDDLVVYYINADSSVVTPSP